MRMALPEIDRYAIAAEMFKDQPEGFPIDSDIDLRAIELPEGDDMGIKSDDDAEEEEVATESGFGSIIGNGVQTLEKKMLCEVNGCPWL